MLKLKQPSVVLTELLGELIEGFEFYNQRNDSRPGLLLHALHTGILDRLHTHTHTHCCYCSFLHVSLLFHVGCDPISCFLCHCLTGSGCLLQWSPSGGRLSPLPADGVYIYSSASEKHARTETFVPVFSRIADSTVWLMNAETFFLIITWNYSAASFVWFSFLLLFKLSLSYYRQFYKDVNNKNWTSWSSVFSLLCLWLFPESDQITLMFVVAFIMWPVQINLLYQRKVELRVETSSSS